MITSVCTTSTETQFAAIGDLMVLLNSTASSSGLDKALTDATAWTERFVTNRIAGSIRRSLVRETVAGSGSQQLMLSRTPILKVVRMFDATDTGQATEYCSTDFRIEDADAGFVTLTNNAGFSWDYVPDYYLDRYPRPGQVVRRWLVEYEAGWQLACSSSTGKWASVTTGRTLPEDVERAVLLKAADFAQGSVGQSISGMRVGPLALNYASESLDPVVELLSPYRREA